MRALPAKRELVDLVDDGTLNQRPAADVDIEVEGPAQRRETRSSRELHYCAVTVKSSDDLRDLKTLYRMHFESVLWEVCGAEPRGKSVVLWRFFRRAHGTPVQATA